MRVSIITLALDTPFYIDEAIVSVSHPKGADIQHIIVHDGSEADFADLASRYPTLQLIRGPGRGATAAANAGLAHATGDFIFFLNSDDRLTPNAIAALVEAAARAPLVEIWTGKTRLFTTATDGTEITLRTVADRTATVLTLNNVLDDFPLLTARFVRREVYEQFVGLDERFHTCSDREFMTRLALVGVSEAPLDEWVSELRFHEGSSTIRRPQSDVPAYLPQHVELARRWLADATLSPEQRAIFKDWHARELMRLAFYNGKAGRWGEVIRVLLSGFGVDPFWFWRAQTIIGARHLRRRDDDRTGSL